MLLPNYPALNRSLHFWLQDWGAGPGLAVSGYFGYLIGVSNELAMRHVPEVEPRWDDLAGPPGRRGDQARGRAACLTELPGRIARLPAALVLRPLPSSPTLPPLSPSVLPAPTEFCRWAASRSCGRTTCGGCARCG